MTPERRAWIVSMGIYLGIELLNADGVIALRDIIVTMHAQRLITAEEASPSQLWILDVYRLGPFDHVGIDGSIKFAADIDIARFKHPGKSPP